MSNIRTKFSVAAISAALVLTSVGCSDNLLSNVAEECGAEHSIMDDGDFLFIHVNQSGTAPNTLEELYCVLEELDTPGITLHRIETTRVLDGVQEAEWGSVKARWTYLPGEAGFEITLERK